MKVPPDEKERDEEHREALDDESEAIEERLPEVAPTPIYVRRIVE